MVYYVKGDLLKSDCQYICHQVNCQGRMGSGIAKQIRERWPVVYEHYMTLYNTKGIDVRYELLGEIQVVNVESNRNIINMFGQESYGYDGRRYTSYDAFWSCLGKIKATVPKGSKIGFPAKIGCGLGGANWEVIFKMIEQVLAEDYEVYIYILEE